MASGLVAGTLASYIAAAGESMDDTERRSNRLTHKCPVCRAPSIVQVAGDAWRITCSRCGPFSVSGSALPGLTSRSFTLAQIANISGYIRESRGISIQSSDLAFLESLRTPPVAEKAEK